MYKEDITDFHVGYGLVDLVEVFGIFHKLIYFSLLIWTVKPKIYDEGLFKEIQKAYLHELYLKHPKLSIGDIAVVELKSKLEWMHPNSKLNVKPACIPREEDYDIGFPYKGSLKVSF